ncbi:MAG: hypothetical protein AAF938_06440 [Myxococcota bacterium]
MTEKMMALAHSSTTYGPPRQRIEYSITGSTGTPLPSDLSSMAVEIGTGALRAAPTVSEVVREMKTVVQKAGVLRTTEAGNALVDELLATHTKGLAVRRPLTRRLKSHDG